MAREIYVSITWSLACFRYTSVTKYTGKWNVVWALQFSRSGVWISCEAFMTQFQPTTFIMTCKRGVGITVSMQREPLGTTSLFVSPFLIDVTSVYPSRSFLFDRKDCVPGVKEEWWYFQKLINFNDRVSFISISLLISYQLIYACKIKYSIVRYIFVTIYEESHIFKYLSNIKYR